MQLCCRILSETCSRVYVADILKSIIFLFKVGTFNYDQLWYKIVWFEFEFEFSVIDKYFLRFPQVMVLWQIRYWFRQTQKYLLECGIDFNVWPLWGCYNHYGFRNLKVWNENVTRLLLWEIHDPCADGFIYYKFSLCVLGQPTIAKAVVVKFILLLCCYSILYIESLKTRGELAQTAVEVAALQDAPGRIFRDALVAFNCRRRNLGFLCWFSLPLAIYHHHHHITSTETIVFYDTHLLWAA